MAKKKSSGVPNRHLYSRISFMYQAAAYLAEAGKELAEAGRQGPTTTGPVINTEQSDSAAMTTRNMSRKLLTDLRAVTLKSQIRISPYLKRTICKGCDALLIEGRTCISTVENGSKGAEKPWADVLVLKCRTCHRSKRFPVHAPRQQRRPLRAAAKQEAQGEPQQDSPSSAHACEPQLTPRPARGHVSVASRTSL